MASASKTRQACVQFSDPEAPGGVEITGREFLKQCKVSALARFADRANPKPTCRTVEHLVPAKHDDSVATGNIIAHISNPLIAAWEDAAPGTAEERTEHVNEQLQLVLEDLADQDMHGYLALTDDQRAIYEPDLIQLTCEAMSRTTFGRLGRTPVPHWEGTLVESVRPPYLVLVVSIGL